MDVSLILYLTVKLKIIKNIKPRGITLLGIPGNVYATLVTARLQEIADAKKSGEEQDSS